jgi:hypothetical protein
MTEEENKYLRKIKGCLSDIERELNMSDLRKDDYHTYSRCMRSVGEIETIVRKLFRT